MIAIRVIAVVVLLAQADTPPRFDAAEVRVSNPGTKTDIGIVNGQLRLAGIDIRRLIAMAYAYKVREDAIRGGPRWLDSDRFDVVAKASQTSEPVLLTMLQTLLADRFSLKIHFDDEPRLVYVLSVAASGPKLAAAAGGEAAGCRPSTAGPEQVRLACTGVTMQSLARRLPLLTNLDLPLLDNTGLNGAYDFQLDWTWAAPTDPPPAGQPNRPTAEGLTNSLRRLGLLLERRKHAMPVLVVDSVERVPKE